MESQRWARAGQRMYLAGIAELVFDGHGGGRLNKFSKRVPVLANPHEGSSIRKASSARKITVSSLSVIIVSSVVHFFFGLRNTNGLPRVFRQPSWLACQNFHLVRHGGSRYSDI